MPARSSGTTATTFLPSWSPPGDTSLPKLIPPPAAAGQVFEIDAVAHFGDFAVLVRQHVRAEKRLARMDRHAATHGREQPVALPYGGAYRLDLQGRVVGFDRQLPFVVEGGRTPAGLAVEVLLVDERGGDG